MKSVYLLPLLVALIFANLMSLDASPLEQRWFRPCCPISRCVFTQGATSVNATGFTGNTFNGYLQFVQSPRNALQIDGFINIVGVVNGPIESFYDLHVADCSTANTTTPGDPTTTIDLDSTSFNTPIFTTRSLSMSDITGQCCFVVEEFASISGSSPPNERILGIAPITPVVDCIHFPTHANITAGPSNATSP